MIPESVETRIALHYFQRYLPEEVHLKLSGILLPYYMDDDNEPSVDEMVLLAVKFLEQAMKEYDLD